MRPKVGAIPEARYFETLVSVHLNEMAVARGIDCGIRNVTFGRTCRAEVDLAYLARDANGGLVVIVAESKNGPVGPDWSHRNSDVREQLERQKLALSEEFDLRQFRAIVVCNSCASAHLEADVVLVGLPVDFLGRRNTEPLDLLEINKAWTIATAGLSPDLDRLCYNIAKSRRPYDWWIDPETALREIQSRLENPDLHPNYRERLLEQREEVLSDLIRQ